VLLNSWFTKNSGQYARAVLQAGGAEETSWTKGPWDVHPLDVPPEVEDVYADVQQIHAKDGTVFITASGLASHVMGPWPVCDSKGNPFPNWPIGQPLVMKIPEVDTSSCENTPLSAIGAWVNGTAIYNMLDAWFFTGAPDTGVDSTPGPPSVWNRNAYVAEKSVFDPALYHAESAKNQYHSETPAGATRR
jgi:hypothetical protein